MDAGRGLVLRGNGRADSLRSPGTGQVTLYGNSVAPPPGDYDGDGKVDLVVGQNGAATQLLHNTGGRAGVRVRLVGPPGNRTASAPSSAPINAGRPGPARSSLPEAVIGPSPRPPSSLAASPAPSLSNGRTAPRPR